MNIHGYFLAIANMGKMRPLKLTEPFPFSVSEEKVTEIKNFSDKGLKNHLANCIISVTSLLLFVVFNLFNRFN